LFLRIYDQFPGDVGTLAVFFLNYVKLQPGEAIYLAANEPHAYLSGELVEAMANSDNVIRAGLTPKLRDTEVCHNSL
jgi:mannose-6-phosphate isomerase